MKKNLFDNLIQVGFISANSQKMMSDLGDLLSMNDFRIAEYPPKGEENIERIYYGKEGNFKGRFCFFDFNNIEFEIIESLGGENIWEDFLKISNGVSIHHLKFLIDSHEEVFEHFKSKGIKLMQKGASVGKNKGRSFAYYDTFEKLGFYIEVMDK